MALNPGTRLGAYEIVAPLGAGGMGVVYRATDTRLGRSAAIKTLPPGFAADPDRRLRFEREARTLAALNHPNIAQIYGLEDVPASATSPATLALAMELVEGEDLAQRLSRGPVPLDDVWPLAIQIAEGLEAAHEAGIVHRDLKPANIRVTPDGVVKVLDFGLAKSFQDPKASSPQDPVDSPTITTPAMTMHGVILGTAAYMAPEQAKGKVVDRRVDIWAFGCVLYELITGRRAFDGDDVSEILGAILKTEPEWARLPATTPARVRTLLKRCLTKDLRTRVQHIGDARLDLVEAASAASEQQPFPRVSMGRRWALPAAIGGAATAAALLLVTGAGPTSTPGDDSVLQYTIEMPTTRLLGGSNFALSPDGSTIAYAAAELAADPADYGALHLLRLDTLTSSRVGAVGNAVRALAWSPDGRALLTYGRGLQVTQITSGIPQQLGVGTGGLVYGAAWGEGPTYVLATAGQFQVFPGAPEGATPLAVPGAVPATEQVFPSFLADGRRLIFVQRQARAAAGEICLGTIDSVDVRCLGVSTTSRVVSGGDSLLYMSNRELLAHRFDDRSGALIGDPVRLAADVAPGYLGIGAFSVSTNGRLAYRTGDAGLEQFTWFDKAGRVVGTAATKSAVLQFDLSRDGRVLAVTDAGRLWVTDLSRDVTTQVDMPIVGIVSPVLSSNGSRLAVVHSPDRIAIRSVSGGSEPTLIEHEGVGIIEDWSADERWIATTAGLLISTTGAPAIRFATVPESGTLDEVEFSSDGRWVAFNLSGPGNRTNAGVRRPDDWDWRAVAGFDTGWRARPLESRRP